jgi:ketosteroid isomerase-like protein
MINAVADQLFDAIERGDYEAVESLWTQDVLVWHSGDPRDNQRARALKVIRWFMEVTATRSYEILDRQFFEGGFVQQHVLRARRADDVSINMRVCIVIKVNADGLITRIDEYFDPVDMAPLLEK